MWTNVDDINPVNGDRVRLYQPILYGRKLNPQDITLSYIGGGTFGDGYCDHCHNPLQQLVQLHIPVRQLTYFVAGCNRAACVHALFHSTTSSKFSCGGGGVFVCQRTGVTDNNNFSQGVAEASVPVATNATSTTNATQPQQQPQTNDWTVDSDDDNEDGDLEKQVAAMELKQSTPSNNSNNAKSHSNTKKKKTNKSGTTTATVPTLPCLELHSLLEPPGKPRPTYDDGEDDEDDDDIVGSISSDAKIQDMLAKYMAEEEDPDILAMLQGSTGGGSGSGSGGGNNKNREKDERLKPDDRALLSFTDRIKRSPRQVIRYAPNGVPLWSVPPPKAASKATANNNNGKKSKNKKKKQQQQQQQQTPIVIPPCPTCGTARRFEFQIMPSLLHVLEVDKYASQQQQQQQEDESTPTNITMDQPQPQHHLDALMSSDYGGMNWGVIAVYTCPNAYSEEGSTATCDGGCCSNRDEYVVVQASVDEAPRKRTVAPSDAPISIKEDQTFDPLTNDGDLLNEEEEDDDNDDDEEEDGEDDGNLVFTMDG